MDKEYCRRLIALRNGIKAAYSTMKTGVVRKSLLKITFCLYNIVKNIPIRGTYVIKQFMYCKLYVYQ